MSIYLLALLIGVVAGMRALLAPAAVAWGANLGRLDLASTPMAFMGWRFTAWGFTVLALVEFVVDQLPKTPSRTSPPLLAARLIMGALCGAAVGADGGALLPGLIAGVVGAVIGAFGGLRLRVWMARAFGRDRPAGLIEDLIAIGLALLTLSAFQ